MSEISSIASANTRPPQKRLIGRYPKVGIRESLEGQTMRTGRRAAALITQNLRHPQGAELECVIADMCIGGAAEAAQCAEKFEREGVGLSLTVTPLLVLWGRDDGYASGAAESDSGV